MRGKSMKISREQLATIIDHTLLKPTATENDIKKLCEEAENYSLGCVCVNPSYVSFAAKLLEGTHVKVASTVGFPLGATLSEVKALEDIEAVVDVARSYNNVIVKAIIEAGYLTESEKVIACELAKEAGANFVKTSTGFAGGATVEDIKLMYKTVGKDLEVKAAGGIRTLKEALTMIEAGASRIGTSSGVAIIEEA
jgi:deoxyribose-phosphate aldolase